MKVGNINHVYFRGNIDNKKVSKPEVSGAPKSMELNSVTQDFNIQMPQAYKKIGVAIAPNGLEIHQYKLANGHKVSIIPMEGSPAIVKNYVNVGAMNEPSDIKGISHFLEHMAFNGTNGENGHIKLEVGDSFKKIEEMGGWANASTNYAITDYVNSTPLLHDNDLERQIQVIAAMTEDLKLSDKMIEKEKGPVCSEINMILDDPKTIAFDQSVRTLFNIKNSTDEMVAGSVKSIKNLTRQDVMDYYNKHYTPENMNLVITGEVNPDDTMKLVAKNFNSKKISQGHKFEEKLIPINNTVRKDFRNDKAVSPEIVMAFAGPKNSGTRENIIYDIAHEYVKSYSVGLKENLKELNTYPYLGCEKIGTNSNTPQMIYLATSTTEEKCEKVLQTIYDTLANIKPISEDNLERHKEKILGNVFHTLDYSSSVNNLVGKAVLNNDIEYVTEYENVLDTITAKEVDDAIKKYFDLNKCAITVIHPTQNNQVSFKGSSSSYRLPINTENISQYKLKNNYNVGFYDSNSKSMYMSITLDVKEPYKKKPGVIALLSHIYDMGTTKTSQKEWDKFQEQNNIEVSGSVSKNGISIYADSSFNNRELIYEKVEELLYNPNLTQENLNKAKEQIRDAYSKHQDTPYSLYISEEAKTNPYYSSKEKVLNNLDSITLDDLKECHEYFIDNARGFAVANLPKEEPQVKQEIFRTLSKFKPVQQNEIQFAPIYRENQQIKVLTKSNNNSQAEIVQIHKFKRDGSIKERALSALTRSILSNSSIGLFDVLREKEHLAYSVYADYNFEDDLGSFFCNIMTTTDNKEIQEFSYDNIQKSINGFNRQINALRNGEFTDKDLANAKLAMKASLLDNEGTSSKLIDLKNGMYSKEGITLVNKMYKEIDKITKEDIIVFASKIFASKPIYAITATQDTLDYNKEYLDNLVK